MQDFVSKEAIPQGYTLISSAVANWAGLDKLSVQFTDDPHATGANLYRNGRNQVGVTVELRAVDRSGDWIMPDADLTQQIFNSLYLVDWSSLAALNWKSSQSNNWIYTDARNDFLTTPSSGSGAYVLTQHRSRYTIGDDGTISYQFYVMCPYNESLTSIGIAAQVRNVPDGYGGRQNIDCAGKTSGIARSTVTLRAAEPRNFSSSELAYVQTRIIVDGDAPSNHKNSKNWLFEYQWTTPPDFPIHSVDWASGENWSANTYFQCGNPKKGYLWMAGGRIHRPSNQYGDYNGNTMGYLMSCYLYSGEVDRPFTVSTPNNAIKLTRFITGNYSYIDGDASNFNRTEAHSVKVTDIYGTVRWLIFQAFTTADESNRPPITSYVDRSA
ncbi:MAG: hypothetical protein KA134_02195 [Achromobacter sp.]|nr:hypothetical protein [Achromobacter sp.]